MEYSTLSEPLIAKYSLCPICFSSNSNHTFPSCEHSFCRDCLQSYLDIKITEGSVLNITCPETFCSSILLLEEIQNLTTECLFQKYLEFHRNKTLEADINFRWCPIRNCEGFDVFFTTNKLTCNKCSHEFCFLCADPWHFDKKCKGEDKSYMKWASSRKVKNCPNCKVRSEKIGGCDHITCYKCNYYWCWKCMKSMDGHSNVECLAGKSIMNVNLAIIIMVTLLPILFPFLVVVLYNFSIFYIGEPGEDEGEPEWFMWIFRHQFFVSVVLVVLSPAIMGLGLVVFVPIAIFIFPCFKIQGHQWSWIIIQYVLFLLLAVVCLGIATAVILLVLGVAPIVGVVLLVLKIVNVIFIRND